MMLKCVKEGARCRAGPKVLGLRLLAWDSLLKVWVTIENSSTSRTHISGFSLVACSYACSNAWQNTLFRKLGVNTPLQAGFTCEHKWVLFWGCLFRKPRQLRWQKWEGLCARDKIFTVNSCKLCNPEQQFLCQSWHTVCRSICRFLVCIMVPNRSHDFEEG